MNLEKFFLHTRDYFFGGKSLKKSNPQAAHASLGEQIRRLKQSLRKNPHNVVKQELLKNLNKAYMARKGSK